MNLKKISILGAIGLSAIVLSGCNVKKAATGSQNQSSSSAVSDSAVVVNYGADGFEKSVNAKVGQQIAFKNSSTGNVQVDSDPHPTHTLYPELNLGVIAAGQSKSVSFSKAGTYTYHNHLNPSQKGTIIVQ